MKSKKSILSLILMIVCAFLLCGCAQVDYSRFVSTDGSIVDKVIVEVDDNAIKYASLSKSDLYREIKIDLENLYIQPVKDKISSILIGKDFTDVQKQEIFNGIYTNVEIMGNQVIAEVRFENQKIFNYYYADVDSDSSDPEIRNGLFFNKRVVSSRNAFAVVKTDQLKSLISKYKGYFGYHFSLDDMMFTQVYASPETDIYSNANTTEVHQGIKMHQWDIGSDNLDFQLEFYTMHPNTVSWYIMALIITGVVILIILLLTLRKKLQSTENNIENKNEINKKS